MDGAVEAQETPLVMVEVNRADVGGFRTHLGPVCARWRRRFGRQAWGLLENTGGPLGA
jgi:hypothetical protein